MKQIFKIEVNYPDKTVDSIIEMVSEHANKQVVKEDVEKEMANVW